MCVRRGFRGTITYEFSIDEPGFWAWVKDWPASIESQAAGLAVEPITVPTSVRGCSCESEEPPYPEVTHGWRYSWSREDRNVAFIYDPDHGRVYFHANYH